MEGVQPEELIQAGIPQELIMQAIQILEQQLAQQAPQQAQQQLPPQAQGSPGEAGLAQTMVG
jgi:SOS response regulatory protein OraA/RecX